MTITTRHAQILGCLLVLATAASASPQPGSSNEGNSSAFTGLAQAPEANLFVGSATTAIRIDVPPGRKELTPKLTLAYNSSGGPSPYGLGWDLPLGRIQRCTKHGVLSCGDASQRNEFVLVLPGASVECRLELAAGNRSGRPCVPAIQESYIRITYNEDSNRWDVWDKSGLHYILGAAPSTRTGSDVTRLFSAVAPCTYTYSWALDHIEDPNGNTLDIIYRNQSGMLYPEQIAYGGNRNVNQPHVFEVSFVWSDEDGFARPAGDEMMNAIGGFPTTLTRLLSKIDVRFRANGIGAPATETIRSYSFLYDFQTDVPDAVGRQSLLSAVTIYDGNGEALSRTDGAPASTTFLYQRNAPDSGRFGFGPPQPASRPSGSPGLLRFTDGAETKRDLLDMNGDGFVDLVESGWCWEGFWVVYLGGKQGFAAQPIEWAIPDSTLMCRIRRTQNNGTDSWTDLDTIDLNGDGIPDFVDSRSLPYRVYFGRVSPNNSGGGFQEVQLWPAPHVWPRHSRLQRDLTLTVDGLSKSWEMGSMDVADLIDLNGDGLLDLVQTPFTTNSVFQACSQPPVAGPLPTQCTALTANWSVWLNTGNGFASTAIAFPAVLPFLRFTAGDGIQAVGIHDLTGDGLPDQVAAHHSIADAWLVYQHTGYSLALGGGDWRAPDECGKSGIHDEDDHRITRDLFDINADGLLDLVSTCGTTWYVRLGRGSGFTAQALPWSAPYGYIRDVDGEGHGTYRDTFDIDGDGMADFVDFFQGVLHRNLGGVFINVCAQASCAPGSLYTGLIDNLEGGKPDLLVQIENGIGGTTTIDYRPSTVWDNTDADLIPRLPFILWTTTRIEQGDGMCGATGCRTAGGHTLATNISYGYGFYDFVAREFRGFRIVRQSEDAGHRHETYFHQDGARKGKPRVADFFAAGSTIPIARTVSVWTCAQSADGADVACPDWVEGGAAVSVRLKSTIRSDGGTELSSDEQRSWDSCGNVTTTVKSGYAARSLTTSTTYSCTSASTNSGYIFDRPVHIWSVENAGTATARTLEEKWFRYDALALGQLTKGNITSVHSWLDGPIIPALPSGGVCPETPSRGLNSCISTTMVYDSLGNVTAVSDANGNTTTTIYDAATNIYPDFITAGAGNARQQTGTVYDPKCGRLRRQSVAYPAVAGPAAQPYSETIYDSFCRPREVWEPYPGGTANVKRRAYAYYQSPPDAASAPFEVAVMELVGGDALRATTHVWVDSHRYFDALGRSLQSNRRAIVGGSATYLVDGFVEFDDRGGITRRYAPFQTGSSAFAATPAAATGSTSFTYDALRRVTRVTQPDGSLQTTDYAGALQTTAKDACHTSGACAGSESITLLDGFGRAVESRIYQKPVGAAATFLTRSATLYDGLGRTLETKQSATVTGWNEATKIATRYDSMGRKIQLLDPDSGTWMYGYDLVGNLVYQDDPAANQHLQFCYDSLNRIGKKHYLDNSAGDYVAYRASACALDAGQIRYTYGETSGPSFGRLIAVDDESGTTVLDYDVRGRTLSASQTITVDALSTVGELEYTYDAADHPLSITYPDGEVVSYAYDGVGQLKSVAGAKPYLSSVTYDLFGRPLLAQHGNGLSDVRTYGSAQQNYRLASLQTKLGSSVSLAYNYEAYSKTGLLTKLTDSGPKGTGNAMDGSCSFAYDGVGRLTAATGPMFSGAYTYDGLGNITGKEGAVLAYSPTRPHTLERINGSNLGLAHDPNGNRTGKPGQAYTYTADDRVERIAVGGATVRFVYDYAGRRVAKIEANGRVTRYYGGLAEAAGEYLTKYYYAGSLLIASNRVWAPQLAGLAAAGPIQVAQLVTTAGPGVLLLVRDDLQLPLALSVGLLGSALLLAPWRRKAIVGVRVRYGHVILVIIAFGASTLPIPVVLRPAAAATATPTRTPARSATRTATRTPTRTATRTPTRTATRTPTRTATRTPTRTATRTPTRSATRTTTRTPTYTPSRTLTASPSRTPTRTLARSATPTRTATRTLTRTPTAIGGSAGVLHYHLDHLGSVHAITDESGSVAQYIRYKPYGEVRGHYDRFGTKLTADTCNAGAYCHEFTAYDSEPMSGLQYANARVYDPQLGMFLTHDPARQFASPYTYTNWNPVNAVDPSGAELTLLAAIVIGAIAGALAGGIQAAVNGASVGDAFKAAAIGGAVGGLAAGVGYVVLQPAVHAATGALTGQLVNAGMQPAFASNVATLGVNGSLLGGSLAQAGYNASRGDYSGLIAIGAAYAMAAGWDALVPDVPANEAAITEFDVRPGDVMGTDEGAYARVISTLDPTGDTGHTQLALEEPDGAFSVLTSDGEGQRVAQLGDVALSGRGYEIYRPNVQPAMGTKGEAGGLWGWIKGNATREGRFQYLGNGGGNVCSSTCNSALAAGGVPTGFPMQTLVTPNQLVRSGGLTRIGRLPYVP